MINYAAKVDESFDKSTKISYLSMYSKEEGQNTQAIDNKEI